MANDPIVGIDLGTSNSAVAYADGNGQVQVLADDASFKIHPSVVSFHPNGGVVVGAPAKQRKVIDPANTVFSVKRLIGRRFQSPEVQTAKQRMPYQIKEGGSHMPMIVTRAGEFAVPEISAIILDHMKGIATARLGKEVHRAVVTVPASFNDAQRSATATAGAVAGLTIVRVLNEPTAAALAYGHTKGLKQLIAVYDFGGGTFDVTILKLQDQVYEVLGTAGDSFLGGDDLDERLVDKMVQKFLAENRVDLRSNEVSMMRLRAVAEQTKIELSRRSRAVVRIDEIAYGPNGTPLNLQIEISRDEFVSHVAPIVDRTFPVCDEALALAGIGVDAIDDVLLVGGTTKIPDVREKVTRFFNKQPRVDIAPEEAVAIGAGLQASALDRMLSRKSSAKISAVQAAIDFPPDPTNTGEITLGAAGDTQVRRTNPYGARPDTERPPTEYSVKRSGARDEFTGDTMTEPVERTTAPQAVPLARMTQPGRAQTAPVATVKPMAKTMYGVPEAPGAPQEIYELEPSAHTIMPNAPRTTAPASVPPPPRMTQAVPVVPPPTPPPPRSTSPRPVTRAPAPTQQQVAQIPPILPPTAPTLYPTSAPSAPTMFPGARPVAAAGLGLVLDALDSEHVGPKPVTSPGVFAPSDPDTLTRPDPQFRLPTFADPDLEPSSAGSTAKGFHPPAAAPTQTVRAAVPTVLDVTPRGLGIGTVAGFCEELIRRNARLPTEAIKLFTTVRDQQDVVRIVVCQGESRRLDNNTVIGDLKLENLPPRPRGETSIEVTFQLDASGILQVRARDSKTGKEQRASLDLVGNMTDAEVGVSRDRLAALRR